jgi:hypothetical protein
MLQTAQHDILCAQWHKTSNSRETSKKVGCLQTIRRATRRSSPLTINYQIQVIACCIRHTSDWWISWRPYGSSATKNGSQSGRFVKRCATKGNSAYTFHKQVRRVGQPIPLGPQTRSGTKRQDFDPKKFLATIGEGRKVVAFSQETNNFLSGGRG